MRVSVVVFPGSSGADDVARVASDVLEANVDMVWHDEDRFEEAPDLVIFPGGLSYGNYLRPGAIAAHSPIVSAARRHAENGGLLLGIGNGFQILTEAKLLQGTLLVNRTSKFICGTFHVMTENSDTPFTRGLSKGEILRIPVAHKEGLFHLNEKELNRLEKNRQIVFRYTDPNTGESGESCSPDGSLNGIAGICNETGNVLGLMPHPERGVFAHLNGGTGAVPLWQSIAKHFSERSVLQ